MSRDSRPEACRSERSPPLIQRPPCHLALIPGTSVRGFARNDRCALSLIWHGLWIVAAARSAALPRDPRLSPAQPDPGWSGMKIVLRSIITCNIMQYLYFYL